MKHLFIVNPNAGGKHRDYTKTVKAVEEEMAKSGGEYEIYYTKAAWDAAEKVRLEAEKGGELRVYACGGDGTMNECVNGAAGYSNAAVAPFPCGTGNDFVKLFGEEADSFNDLDRLINGFVHPIDVIRVNDKYSVNICSVGFDARVGTDVHKYSKLDGMAGYIISLIVNFFKGINSRFTVTLGDRTVTDEFALICACNGKYYGGGFNPVPDAVPDDGIMDTLIVRKCSRLRFIAVIKKYATGRSGEIKELVTRENVDRVRIESDKDIAVNLDGELLVSKNVEFQIVHNGVNLLCPMGMEFFDKKSVIGRKQK
jgi:YegS/Rv2252/BmrU family lipid kinase